MPTPTLFRQRGYNVWCRLFVCLFVCLLVRRITQNWMIPEFSNLVYGMSVGYTRSGMILGLKGEGHRVNNSILHTRTAIHRHSLGGVTSRLRLSGCLVRASLTFTRWRNQSSAWDQTLWVPSSFTVTESASHWSHEVQHKLLISLLTFLSFVYEQIIYIIV